MHVTFSILNVSAVSSIIHIYAILRLHLHEIKLAFKPSFKPTEVITAIIIIYFGLKRFLANLQTNIQTNLQTNLKPKNHVCTMPCTEHQQWFEVV